MWWKYVAAAVLFAVTVLSLKTPLSPGILSVHDNELSADDATLSIIGYHTHFKSGPDMQVWLEIDDWTICASELTALDETHLLATFDISLPYKAKLLNLFINNAQDGTILQLGSVRTKGLKIDPALAAGEKCYSAITVADHNHFTVPFRVILWETIRNLNFHVPMWFAMIFIMCMSMVQSIRLLAGGNLKWDLKSEAAVKVGLVFAFAGLATGSLWARFTWGAWWTADKQLNGAALVTLIYLAYLVLRSTVEDDEKRARTSAVYNIFAFVMLLLFIFIIPRMGDSIELHPGKGGNPAFSNYDLDNKLRMMFYPAVIAWIAIGYWIYSIRYRISVLDKKLDDYDEETVDHLMD